MSYANLELWFRLVGVLFFFLGAIQLRPGWKLMRKSSHLVHHGIVTTGSYKGGKKFQFTTEAGRTFDFYNPFTPRSINMSVPVMYDSQNPYRAYFAPSSRYFHPITQFTAGCFFSFFGLISMVGLDVTWGIVLLICLYFLGSIITRYHKHYCRKVIISRFGRTNVL